MHETARCAFPISSSNKTGSQFPVFILGDIRIFTKNHKKHYDKVSDSGSPRRNRDNDIKRVVTLSVKIIVARRGRGMTPNIGLFLLLFIVYAT